MLPVCCKRHSNSFAWSGVKFSNPSADNWLTFIGFSVFDPVSSNPAFSAWIDSISDSVLRLVSLPFVFIFMVTPELPFVVALLSPSKAVPSERLKSNIGIKIEIIYWELKLKNSRIFTLTFLFKLWKSRSDFMTFFISCHFLKATSLNKIQIQIWGRGLKYLWIPGNVKIRNSCYWLVPGTDQISIHADPGTMGHGYHINFFFNLFLRDFRRRYLSNWSY